MSPVQSADAGVVVSGRSLTHMSALAPVLRRRLRLGAADGDCDRLSTFGRPQLIHIDPKRWTRHRGFARLVDPPWVLRPDQSGTALNFRSRMPL